MIGTLLAAGHAAAFKRPELNARLQPAEDVESVLRRDAEMMATLTQRQDANPVDTAPLSSLTPASGDASGANMAKWEEQTRAACMASLATLNGQASNPSGIAVCYNLPFLDTKTGVFQAELRMYNVSAPINPWQGVTAADVSMTLSYLGATVQNMQGNFTKRDLSAPIVDGQLYEKRQTQSINGMKELKVLMYVGRINDNLMGSAMTQASLKPLLIPQIDLAAKNPSNGQEVETTLSSQEASFVNGIFSKAGTAPTNADPQAAASASAAVSSADPFVVPGTALAFFPIGLVVTSTWAFFFILAVGFGTFGRIQYRDQYRRRVRAESARGVRTI
ncbi:ribosome-recycling factor [Pyrenophora seminiperda CCB06]|uniref:Ribosome-recycling factor n=1 Tax=Pyrenophora seminiperda CCB06 TaxID=1302712 RepID=A0A3M7M6P8_9PLEO|nr:ribosome-recycling factor [Pyrenophora seminiperda CCB06]